VAALHSDAMETGVVVGDLNADPGSAELAPLRERFADAWELAAERDDRAGRHFWRRAAGSTHPAEAPRHRVDQVWVSPGIAVASARVLDGAGASDHLPLVVDLLVPSGV
jgi:endonuclease/exonuclease/phosphatase family metal-dependent hydrolase